MPWNTPGKILASIDAEGGLNACWPWLKHVDKDGYGRLKYQRLRLGAHQWSYIHHIGEIKKDLCVCHSCDNPICCNPTHLWLGTMRENNIDRNKKGRYKPPFPKGSVRITKGKIRKTPNGKYSAGLRHKHIGTFQTKQEAELAIQQALVDWPNHLDQR